MIVRSRSSGIAVRIGLSRCLRAAGGLRGRRDALLRLCDGQDCERFGLQPIELVSGRNPPADELFAVKLDDASVTLDSTLHRGPRDRRIVARKVAMTAVAYMVDGDVRAKFHSILGCELRHKHHRIGIIRIDMNDWRIDCPCGIRAVQRRPRIPGMRNGRADLVVQNQMQCSAHTITARLREIERLGHHALRGERSIAVNEDRQHLPAGTVRFPILQRSRHAAYHRRHTFQVRRIVREHNMDVAGGRLYSPR